MGWLTDSFNIFVVTLSMKRLSVQYGIGSLEELTLALSLTQLFRSAGALVFGLMADRFGRRWLLTLDMLGMAGTVLGTTFILDYSDFLVVRGLVAFLLGGTYGTAVGKFPIWPLPT
jgi:SHS family lactate transporter-like MFS transporter